MIVESYLIEAHMFRIKDGNLEFLLLKRAENEIYPGIWQMVTGSVKQNEPGYRAALREIREETGLVPVKFWVVPHINSFYSAERDSVCMVPVFAALLENNSKVIISSEHSEYKWLDPGSACNLLAWEGQRESVKTIEKYFLNEYSTLKFVDLSNKIKTA